MTSYFTYFTYCCTWYAQFYHVMFSSKKKKQKYRILCTEVSFRSQNPVFVRFRIKQLGAVERFTFFDLSSVTLWIEWAPITHESKLFRLTLNDTLDRLLVWIFEPNIWVYLTFISRIKSFRIKYLRNPWN